MKSTLVTISVLCIVWVICSGGAASAYQNSLADWYRGSIDATSEQVTRMIQSMEPTAGQESIQSSISITSEDGSAIGTRIIDSDGTISDSLDFLTLSEPTSVGLDIDNGNDYTHKIIQALPQSRIIVSQDGLNIMQVSQTQPVLQIYYGYRSDDMHPFEYLYKVDSLENRSCESRKVTFADKSMTVAHVDCNAILSIMNSQEIPDFGELP